MDLLLFKLILLSQQSQMIEVLHYYFKQVYKEISRHGLTGTKKNLLIVVLSRHPLLPIWSFARSSMSDNRMHIFKSDCKDITVFI